MKLTVLLDNNTYIDEYYLGEPGVSYLIEDGDTKILMDTGYSGVFLDNAEKLKVDLSDLDVLVLSHGHNDHTGGLSRFFESGDRSRVTLVAHPKALDRKFSDGEEIGSFLRRTEIAGKCRLLQSQTPLKLSERVTWLGEIPRTVEFEEPYAIGETESAGVRRPDYVMDDSALIYNGEKGLYVITGCSHSGVCNILEYAMKVSGARRVQGLIGGFHLFNDHSPRTAGTVSYIQKLNIPELYPCHCTSFAVRASIHRALPVKEVGVGLTLVWE